MHRRRRGGRGRFPIQPNAGTNPMVERMIPEPQGSDVPIHIDRAELEALKLVDLDGMYQEQAGRVMGVSRGTIWRLLVSARKKVISALFEGRPLVVGLPVVEDTKSEYE